VVKRKGEKNESSKVIEAIISTCSNDLEGECRAGNEDVTSMVVVVVSSRGRSFPRSRVSAMSNRLPASVCQAHSSEYYMLPLRGE
jgi:hypothetical protein